MVNIEAVADQTRTTSRGAGLLSHIKRVGRRHDCQEWMPLLAAYDRKERQLLKGYRGGPWDRLNQEMRGPIGDVP